MSDRLANKRAVIIGAAPGNLGDVLARRYLSEGAQVIIAGRREVEIRSLGKELGSTGVRADITKESDLLALFTVAMEELGGVDIAVNCTGWGLLVPFLENSHEQLMDMCAVQFVGPFHFFQQAVAAMTKEEGNGGSLIQISSVTAQIMMDNHAAYMGTKAGFDHVMRCIAHEYGDRGIRANSIAPGGIADTPMSGGGLDLPAVTSLYAKEIPLLRSGSSLDVADAALWLASDESSFVTGQVLHVSGGQTLRRNPRLSEVMAAFGG